MLKRKIRHKRIRAKIFGTAKRPRLSVFRSSKGIHAQIVNDEKGETFVYAESKEVKGKKEGKINVASEVGKLIAQKSLKKGIENVVFDRSGYMYHGRVKALAEAAKSEGLKF